MLPCSDPEASEDEVLVWLEAGQLSTEQEGSEEVKDPTIEMKFLGWRFITFGHSLSCLFANTIAERNILDLTAFNYCLVM